MVERGSTMSIGGRSRWHLVLAVAVVLIFASGVAGAASKYDANNADKVDGRHAVGPKAATDARAGRLVATDGKGRLPLWAMTTAPDAARLGGVPARNLASQSIPPQSAFVSSGASMSTLGPVLPRSGGKMTVGFTVPRGHRDAPLRMRVVFFESSAAACTVSWITGGIAGPDGPNSVDNVHNGGWKLPPGTSYSGTLDVPAGPGSAHVAMFEWPFLDRPGMAINFEFSRSGDPADTCGPMTIAGLELRY
jgi:hypothetical protein